MTHNEVPEPGEVRRVLLEAGAVRFGEFTLASGLKSDVYVDVKKAWTDPARLDVIARALAARVTPGEERLAGMELGAVPLVVATALRLGRPFIVIRKAAKEHGTRQRLIEDVATSGGSVAQSIEVLRSAGARVERALVVVDREQGARERLAQLGVRLEALATLTELRGAPV
ncbi:MAG: orotate phosphoribosyltransferase [Thermoplasmata archaeon]